MRACPDAKPRPRILNKLSFGERKGRRRNTASGQALPSLRRGGRLCVVRRFSTGCPELDLAIAVFISAWTALSYLALGCFPPDVVSYHREQLLFRCNPYTIRRRFRREVAILEAYAASRLFDYTCEFLGAEELAQSFQELLDRAIDVEQPKRRADVEAATASPATAP